MRSLRHLVAAAALTPLLVASSNGEGMFATQATYPAGDGSFSVTTGDFNGDGLPDMATANSSSENVSVLLNQGVLIGDVNQDGVIDQRDVGPFVALLVSGDFQTEADINCDGVVNLLDIAPFVDLLSGG